MPRFSIIVPMYDAARFVTDCLDSLLSQDWQDWEAIVVDDASTDGSADLVEQAASRDDRIRLCRQPRNGGSHLARKTGVAASHGDYVLFLDSDDRLRPHTLAALDQALASDNFAGRDILHFGLRCSEQDGFPDSAARSFERWANADAPAQDRRQLLTSTFLDGTQDWHMTHRAFAGDLCRRAFAAMTDARLIQAEDGYEFFVLAGMSQGELTRNDIIGYDYFIGRGVTASTTLDADAFLLTVHQMRDSIDATASYAQSTGDALMVDCAKAQKARLVETTMNEWFERVADDAKPETAREAATLLGPVNVSAELFRFVRDRAYSFVSTGTVPASDDMLYAWWSVALSVTKDIVSTKDYTPHWHAMRSIAQRHLGEIDVLRREQDLAAQHERYGRQRIRIFVTTHKDVDRPDSDILQPVQVGLKPGTPRFPWAFQDDEGENISDLNPMYCELTTQYWAWKNVDADYYGFCHYRRYFSFSETSYPENSYGEVMDGYIDQAAVRKYGLDDETIRSAIAGCDIVTTRFGDLRKIIDRHGTPAAVWKAAPALHDEDLRRCYAILCRRHPDYRQDADAFLKGNRSCFCNMFIMRKELFREYCDWLFPLLEEFVRQTDFSHYSREALRTPGHLSERLLNIWIMHRQRTGGQLKLKELQCVHFTHPEPQVPLRPLDLDDVPPASIVPVVFAADNNYVPQLTTTIYSAMRNASPDRHYDVVVLQRDISGDNQARMHEFFRQFGNMTLRFANVDRMVSGHDLSTNNEHISVETYYRFLIQKALPFYDKVLYLDSDIVIEGDIAELYDTDLGDSLLAAVRDIDFLGNLNVKHGKRMGYAKTVLGMSDPYDYFQAGVLVLNTRAMRERYTIAQWLKFASNPAFIYNDQDVLNAHCEGQVTYLPWEWNVVHNLEDRVGRIFALAPEPCYDAYLRSREHPRIIHYAGYIKPWTDPDCDFAPVYWSYARHTPFYESLLRKAAGAAAAQKAPAVRKPQPAMGDDNPLRRIIDPLAPLGSNRREILKAIGRAVRGRK